MPVNSAETAADLSGSQPSQLFSNEQLAALQQMMNKIIHKVMKEMRGLNLNASLKLKAQVMNNALNDASTYINFHL